MIRTMLASTVLLSAMMATTVPAIAHPTQLVNRSRGSGLTQVLGSLPGEAPETLLLLYAYESSPQALEDLDG